MKRHSVTQHHILWASLLALLTAPNCVSRGKYDAKVAELESTQAALEGAQRENQARRQDVSTTRQRLDAAQAALTASNQRSDELLAKLRDVSQRATELERLAADRHAVVSELNEQLEAERQLLTEFRALAQAYGANTPDELKRSLEELQGRVRATEAALRVAQVELDRERRLVQRLKTLIDAGTLRVRRRAGRLVVELPGDIHFGAGSAKLTAVGESTLEQLAPVLQAENDRLFVVEGHTDNQPIRVSGFRSNWHLGANRAEVAREALVAGGLNRQHVAIASWADLLPACPEVDEEACRGRNRRVEVLLLPRFE